MTDDRPFVADRLEPFFDDVDGLILRVRDLARYSIKGEPLPDTDPGFLPVEAVRYLQAAGINLKALWYHYQRLVELDAEYKGVVRLPDTDSAGYSIWYTRLSDDRWTYFPFFEASELAALLGAARASVEMFCQGAGLVFGTATPQNLGGLRKVLKGQSEPRATQLDTIANTARDALLGILFDPKKPKKPDPNQPEKAALRNLVQHLEEAPIRFFVGPDGMSDGAMVDSRHPQLIRFPNYRVVVIAGDTWGKTRTLLSDGLRVIVEILEERRIVAAKAGP
jgi:hypothetical protein